MQLGMIGLSRMGSHMLERGLRLVEVDDRHFGVASKPGHIALGGGNADRLPQQPPQTHRGDSADAFAGGLRLFEPRIYAPRRGAK